MEYKKQQGIIEAILFAAGRQVEIKELMSATELGQDEITSIIEMMKNDYMNENRGIEIIKVGDAFQLCAKKENYDYIYPIFDKRSKPNLSPAALEVISIIAYNPKITRAEIEAIRGVGSDGSIYKLLEYELIQEAGRMDAPGRPMMYETTPKFLKMFGLSNLDELPELPRYKLDENQQIVIDEYIKSLNRINQKTRMFYYIIEGSYFSIETLKKYKDDFVLIVLINNYKSPKEFYNNIKKNDTVSDWTSNLSDEELMNYCEILYKSEQDIKKICKELNIKYYVTGNNRIEVIDELIKDIKEMVKY